MPKIAFRAVRGRRVFMEVPEAVKGLATALDEEAKPYFIARHEEIVADWKHKPEFKARKFIRPEGYWLNVFPTGKYKDIWVYVSRGTRRHKIRARRAPALAFVWGGPGSYRPKTRPGSGIAGPSFRGLGKVVGGELIRPVEVDHPGNEGRLFEEFIARSGKEPYARMMENAWRRIIRSL